MQSGRNTGPDDDSAANSNQSPVSIAPDEESASIHRSGAGPSQSPTGFVRLAREAAPYIRASSTLTALVVGGALGGRWLDGRLETQPWLTLVGVFLGAGLGLYELARVALRKQQDRPGEDGNE